jgi:hypothetical protein
MEMLLLFVLAYKLLNIGSFDDAASTNVGVLQYLSVITTAAQYMLVRPIRYECFSGYVI